jgi:putative ABC transport system ATP-binding protein
VYENIGFPLALNRVTGKERDKRILELLDRVGLRDSQQALPSELSGGEVQRVAFARAVAHRPKILLADEPTASLDSITARDLIQLMLEVIQEQASSLIVSTHDPVVIDLADNILHLRDGRMVEEESYTTL